MDRTQGIGGTDIAAIMGLSRWRSPLDVYREKIGEPAMKEVSPAMYWGTALEDLVAKEYVMRTGRRVRRVNRPLVHPNYVFLVGHIDRAVIGDRRILECKTAGTHASHEWGAEGTDQVPDAYIAQCQWYLGLSGAQICDLAVLIGGQDYRIYSIERDDGLIEHMVRVGVEFWSDHVMDRIPPAPRTPDEAAALWPRHDAGKTVEVGHDVASMCDQLADINGKIKALEEQADSIKARIMLAMGDAEVAAYGGQKIATWREQSSTRIDTRRLRAERPDIAEQYSVAQSTRVFRLTKGVTQ